MAFYSKLTRELKRQFKTSDIAIPETRAQCVAVAQRVWEGLYPNDSRRNLERDSRNQRPELTNRPRYASEPTKYPRPDSRRDRTDRYRTSHRRNEQRDDVRNEKQPAVICYNCQQPGHYSTSCPKRKERHQEAKIQSAQRQRQQSEASERPSESHSPERSLSPQTSSEEPQILSDSDDSLN
jgi:hypothetical protein